MGRFPSGQRGQTVNLLAPPSKVRILLSPLRYLVVLIPLFFYKKGIPLEELFYSKGLNFSCKQCSGCCRHDPGYVYLSQFDIDNLCKVLKITEKELINKYCRTVPYYDGTEVISLLEKPNFDCIFWNNGCTVYSGRPIQCSTYPFWTFLLESKDRWDKEAESCPGINNGNMLKKNEICVILNKYKDNKFKRVTTNEGEEGVEQ